jgi:hypothetical protein
VLAAVVLAGLGTGVPLRAQEAPAEPVRAVLLSGPVSVRGIPVYAPNRIPAFQGTYALEADEAGGSKEDSEEEPRILTVMFTRQDLFIPQGWVPRRCDARRLFQAADAETFALCYPDERGFFLFLFFPEAEEPADWCLFTDRFIERFLFLYNFVESETDIPFPAILELG